jgi:hypothetical protein
MTGWRREGPLVPPYTVTGGRTAPSRNILDPVTLVTARLRASGLVDEPRKIVEHCQGGVLSIIDVAGRLGLSISVTKVLVSDLIDSGHLRIQVPFRDTKPTPELLERVLSGLQRLK